MRQRIWLVFIGIATFGQLCTAADDKSKPKSLPGNDLFGPNKVWQFDLNIPAREYEAMQPPGNAIFGGAGGRPGLPKRPAEQPPAKAAEPGREAHKSVFGMDFPVAKGDFSASGTILKNVAIRYKGNGSYLPSIGKAKRNFKIEFDQSESGQSFHGLKTLNLNAGAADVTKIREAIAYGIYRDAGVPASRTAFAEVSLTVPGKFEKEYLGLYTVVEQVNRTFLQEHFKDGTGLLMKPERMRGLDYLGDDWERYIANYRPKDAASKEQAQRAIAFFKLINNADDAQFNREIGDYLDLESFKRFMAVTALISSMDSFCNLGHNFYLYLNPTNNKFVFIPWDLDLPLGGFPFLFTPELQMDLSLIRPYGSEHKLTDRLFAMTGFSDSYMQVVKEIATKVFTKERLLRDIEQAEATTKDILARETKAATARKETGGFDFGAFGRTADLRTFADKRMTSISAQLTGKSKGQVPPAFNFGGPQPKEGPAPAAPRPGDVLPGPVQDALRLSPDQRRKLADLQKKVDAQIQELLTDEQKAHLKRLREGGPGRVDQAPAGKVPTKGGRP